MTAMIEMKKKEVIENIVVIEIIESIEIIEVIESIEPIGIMEVIKKRMKGTFHYQ